MTVRKQINTKSVYTEVEQLLYKKLGVEFQIISTRPCSGGCINHAETIHTNRGDFFLKWNAHCASDLFLREADCLMELKRSGNEYVHIPEVIVSTEVKEDTPGIIVMEFLPVSAGKPSDDENLGRGLAMIHKVTRKRYGFDHNTYCGATLQDNTWSSDWPDFFGRQRLTDILEKIDQTQGPNSSEKSVYHTLLQRLPDLLAHKPVPSLNHGDLWSGNYMHTQKGPALIDPASFYADRECDFALMTMFGGFSQRVWDAYDETWPLEKGWKERTRLYEIFHILNHQYLFHGGYGAQALRRAKEFL